MKKFNRPEKPEWYKNKEESWTQKYAYRKQMKWPQFNYKKLNKWLIEIFSQVNFFHCAYCDKITDINDDIEIDHFVPREKQKSKSFCWDNLFLSCHACNKAKLAEFDVRLPKPDNEEFDFLKYFEFNPENGKIVAINEAGKKAITIFNLNKDRRPKLRRLAFKDINEDVSLEKTDEEIHSTRHYSFILELIKII